MENNTGSIFYFISLPIFVLVSSLLCLLFFFFIHHHSLFHHHTHTDRRANVRITATFPIIPARRRPKHLHGVIGSRHQDFCRHPLAVSLPYIDDRDLDGTNDTYVTYKLHAEIPNRLKTKKLRIKRLLGTSRSAKSQ